MKIQISGRRGEGKSIVMNLIQLTLKKHGYTVYQKHEGEDNPTSKVDIVIEEMFKDLE